MKRIVLILITMVSFQSLAANDMSIQDRIYRLEQLTAGNQNRAEIVLELEKLQQQVNELRGQLEEINYKIKSVTDKQKLLYLDMDSRLTDLENNRASRPTANTTSQNSDKNTATSSNITANNTANTNSNPVDSNSNTSIEPVINSVEAEQNDYDVAFSHLRAGRFNAAARHFEAFIQDYPDRQLMDNAYYWLGESFYVQRQYPQALSAFQTLVKNHPNSRKQADAQLKIGYTYFELNDLNNAKKHLSEVVKSFPNSSVSRLAKNRLNQMERNAD